MKLRRQELCPLHHRRNCCGREVEKFRVQRKVWTHGVRRVEDNSVSRGYREIRSNAAMRMLLQQKIREQDGVCGICHNPMEDVREIVPDHIEPKGLGGGWRDDHPDNIQAAHSRCNMEKGSRRKVHPCPDLR